MTKSACNLLIPNDLTKICPNLTIINAARIYEACGLEILDEPSINVLEVLQSVHELSDKVLGNAGLTLLTVPSNEVAHDFLSTHSSDKFQFDKHTLPSSHLQPESGNKTRRILITNAIILNTKNTPPVRKTILLNEIHCEMPAAYDYLFLCTLTAEIFSRALYPCVYQGYSASKSSESRRNNHVVSFDHNPPSLKVNLIEDIDNRRLVGTGAFRNLNS